ncbi:MAG: trypsin-like peptidase domain-containing protein [Candidatus Omnitrophica bacterium]|nr:trypsin-like peptidase domain-containing protein [Candidatus Omnitrophota bacterium]
MFMFLTSRINKFNRPSGVIFWGIYILPLIIITILLTQIFAWADNNLIERIQKTENAVVVVKTELTKTMHTTPPRKATFQRTGAGLIIDPSGIVVTNTHTIINAPFIFIYLKDGTKLPAQLLFASGEYDFSFLRIQPPHPLQSVQWADSSRVVIGKQIIAIGNSDFNNQSIMSGRVTGLIQSFSQGTNDFFELDLDLYRGDSGGPILDDQGQLLGLIMAKRESQQNTSIAIASNKIRQQYLQYKRNMP